MAVVKIEEAKLIELIARSEELRALENGGVDNWGYYCDALNEYRKEKADRYGLDENSDMYEIAQAKLGEYTVE